MRHCEYIKPNGEFCGTPALRGRDYCHWHLTCIARRLRAEKQEATQDRTPLELPPLEDANSIQVSVMMVIDAMLRQRIGPRMSGQLLYALQIASCNLKQGVDFHPIQRDHDGRKLKPVRCTQYDSLEKDFDIAEHADTGVTDEDLRDTLMAASQTDDPQYRRDLVLAYLQHAPEAPAQAGRAAGQQKVLFPRKAPASVQQQWYQQRQANCDAEMDRLARRGPIAG